MMTIGSAPARRYARSTARPCDDLGCIIARMAEDPNAAAAKGGTSAPHQPAAVLLADLVILVVYVWFISVGSWTQWPTVRTYLDQLATAFAHGHTWLDASPDPALLALPNPYNPTQRQGVPYPLDVSLYQGRFYLYFGPTPALLLLIAKLFRPGVIGDQYPDFVFTYGLAVVQSLLILKICRRFFAELSPGILAISVIAAGLIGPYTWLLSDPEIHNAAIVAGQFFFLLGLYTAFDAIDAELPPWKLWLTGVFWAAAITSRLTQAIPIAVVLALLGLRTILRPGHGRLQLGAVWSLVPVAIPLAVAFAALGWYNWIRFGSVFEGGFRYELSGKIALFAFQPYVFSASYVVQNLYNYLLNPFRLRPAFPYFRPIVGPTSSLIASIELARAYGAEQVTGLLYSAPFVLFAVVPAARSINSLRGLAAGREIDKPLLRLVAALAAIALSGFVVLLLYFWVGERFLADFLPALMLLSIIGFWQLGCMLHRSWYGQLLYIFLTMALMGSSIIITTLLAIAMNSDAFRQLNPVLWRQLSNLFRP